MYLLIFEFLGTNEVLVILVVALILLGPRRLPQMSRKLGKSLAEFKKTSEEFKRTWEKEVDMEGLTQEITGARDNLLSENSILNSTVERSSIATTSSEPDQTKIENEAIARSVPPPSVTPVDPSVMRPHPEEATDDPAIKIPTRKRDWL